MILDSEWNELWKTKEDLRQQLEVSEQTCIELAADTAAMANKLTTFEDQAILQALKYDGYIADLQSKLTAMTQERDSALAACAKIREALEDSNGILERVSGDAWERAHYQIIENKKALALDCGKEFVRPNLQ